MNVIMSLFLFSLKHFNCLYYSSMLCKFESDFCLSDILNVELRFLVFDVMPFTL